MYVLRQFGSHIIKFIRAQIFLFQFLGHLSQTLKNMLLGRLQIRWSNLIEVIYFSGARLVIPLVIITALISIALAQTVYVILSPYNLQKQMLPIAQTVLTREILPVFIGFILCIQTALSLINTRAQKEKQSSEGAITEHVLPIIIGITITSLLLYAYSIGVLIMSFYCIFHYKLSLSTYEFIGHLLSETTRYDLIFSAFKTFLLSVIVGIVTGYYYYEAALKNTTLRKAVSRTITRGSFWLIFTSLYMTFLL